MYRITTRTGRTVHTGIESLNEAVFKLRKLELDTKRANIYSPGYYRIEKYDSNSEEELCDIVSQSGKERQNGNQSKDSQAI